MNQDVRDVLLNIIAGLITDSLVSLGAYLGTGSRERSRRTANLPVISQRGKNLEVRLGRAAAQVARRLSGANEKAWDDVRLFLVSVEAISTVRRLLICHLVGDNDSEVSVREDFVAMLGSRSRNQIDRATAITILDAIQRIGLKMMDAAIADGILEVHDLKSEARLTALQRDLQSIRESLRELAVARPDPVAIDRFADKLRLAVHQRSSTIIPPHLDSAPRVPIDSLFVKPRLTGPEQHVGSEEDPFHALFRISVSAEDLLDGLHRIVILGSPGGGKTTFAQKVAYDLTAPGSAMRVGGKPVLPLVVTLREYAAERKTHRVSLVEHFATLANADLQVPPPAGALAHLISSGGLFVIFDGLDELLETQDRQAVARAVEAFALQYPETPMLVTSREVGYEQAPLHANLFKTYRLNGFEQKEVAAYAENWFALATDLSASKRAEKRAAFIRDSETVSDLRGNPLMLALLCNIYRGENYIPQYRPDVIEKCALMLFDRWDRSRGIGPGVPFEGHLRPALCDVGYWLYSGSNLQSGATETAIIARVTEYLLLHRYEDRGQAIEEAVAFVRFCSGRAWVFSDTGSTSSGERIFQFTHRTFLEYFAAAYLARKYETAKEMYETLEARIASREWDVVTQLAFQIKAKGSESAADYLLERTAEVADVKQASLNRVSFAVRALEFMSPSPAINRRVSRRAVEAIVEMVVRRGESVSAEDRGVVGEVLRGLLMPAPENGAIVGDETARCIGASIREGESLEGRRAASKLLLQMSSITMGERDWRLGARVSAFQEALFSIVRDSLRELAVGDRVIARRAYWFDIVSLAEIVEWHGLGVVFRSEKESFGLTQPAILTALVGRMNVGDQKWVRRAEEVGQTLLGAPPPWCPSIEGELPAEEVLIQQATSMLHGPALFAVVAAAAMRAEMHEVEPDEKKTGVSWRRREKAAAARRDRLSGTEWSALGDIERQLIQQWTVGEVNFLSFWKNVL